MSTSEDDAARGGSDSDGSAYDGASASSDGESDGSSGVDEDESGASESESWSESSGADEAPRDLGDLSAEAACALIEQHARRASALVALLSSSSVSAMAPQVLHSLVKRARFSLRALGALLEDAAVKRRASGELACPDDLAPSAHATMTARQMSEAASAKSVLCSQAAMVKPHVSRASVATLNADIKAWSAHARLLREYAGYREDELLAYTARGTLPRALEAAPKAAPTVPKAAPPVPVPKAAAPKAAPKRKRV